MPGPVSAFIDRHYRHFNAAALKDAADGYIRHLAGGGKMLVTLAGAMSTAELGVSLAEMIRSGKVHAISCTGANLEEDIFNLVAHDHYERIPHYRELTAADEQALLDRHLNRVTDTCIPEEEAMRRIERIVAERWMAADSAGERKFPHEFLYDVLLRRQSRAASTRSIRRTAGCWRPPRRNLPIFVPGWEDSTLGNMFAALLHQRHASQDRHTMRERHRVHDRAGATGTEAVAPQSVDRLLPDRRRHRRRLPDLRRADAAPGPAARRTCRCGATSARSATRRRATARTRARCRTRRSPGASSALDTPTFVIESDATIVAPLIFAKVLDV